MYCIRIVAPVCEHCGRGKELLFRQDFDLAGEFVIDSLNIVDLDGKRCEQGATLLVEAVRALVSDPKKHRPLMPVRTPYEKMLPDLCSLVEAMRDHARATIEVSIA